MIPTKTDDRYTVFKKFFMLGACSKPKLYKKATIAIILIVIGILAILFISFFVLSLFLMSFLTINQLVSKRTLLFYFF
mgnify:CR=1 FL=1